MKAIATSVLAASLAMAPLRPSLAGDLLGLYIGGSVAQAHLATADEVPVSAFTYESCNASTQTCVGYYTPTFYSDTVSEHPTAFKLMAGVRPLPFLGAEVAYDDFGRATGHYGDFFGAIATGYNDASNRATLSM